MRTKLALNNRSLRRRKFVSKTAAAGALVTLGTVTGPLGAAAKHLTVSPEHNGRAKPSVRYRGADLRKISVEHFADLIGQNFRLRPEAGATTRARLIEVNASPRMRGAKLQRQPFSLVFDVPQGLERVQGHYRIRHPRVGTLDVLMVPVDLPSRHSRLEAVFA